MKWAKNLSRTDAQQPTQGRYVPYLRLIKGKNPHNNQIWFRQTFFKDQNWGQSVFGKHAVEECAVKMSVSISGINKGVRQFRVTHDDSRMLNKNTPNTWLHYDPATIADLKAKDLEGKPAVLQRNGNDFFLIID